MLFVRYGEVKQETEMDVIAHYDLLVDDNRYRQIPIGRTVRKIRI